MSCWSQQLFLFFWFIFVFDYTWLLWNTALPVRPGHSLPVSFIEISYKRKTPQSLAGSVFQPIRCINYWTALHAPHPRSSPKGLNPFTVSICAYFRCMIIFLLCKDETIFLMLPNIWEEILKKYFIQHFKSRGILMCLYADATICQWACRRNICFWYGICYM